MGIEEHLAGLLLRDARERAGLTQTELARRAHVTQSVISAYEKGRRQPSLPTLATLVQATGFDLAVVLAPGQAAPGGKVASDAPRTGPLSGPLGLLVRQRRRAMITVAAARGVTNLRVFGSVSRGTEHAASDVDLLADLPIDLGLVGLGRLQGELEDILDGTPVDLVPASGLRPEVKLQADREAVPL